MLKYVYIYISEYMIICISEYMTIQKNACAQKAILNFEKAILNFYPELLS